MASTSFDNLIQKIGEMSALELSDFVKALENKFGVSSAMPMAAAQSVATEAPEQKKEEQTEFKVTLQEIGSDKIGMIKAVRKVTTLSLIDAKKAVEEAPTVLAETASKDDAQKIKEAVEAAGGKVKLS